MRNWTIQVTYNTRDDDGHNIRARTVIWVEAEDIPSAYDEAEKSLRNSGLVSVKTIIDEHGEEIHVKGDNFKLGAIIPDHHAVIP